MPCPMLSMLSQMKRPANGEREICIEYAVTCRPTWAISYRLALFKSMPTESHLARAPITFKRPNVHVGTISMDTKSGASTSNVLVLG